MQVRPPLRNLRMTLYEQQLIGPLAAIEHGYDAQQLRHLATVTEGVQVTPRLELSSARIVTATSTLRTWRTCPVRRFGTRILKELASDVLVIVRTRWCDYKDSEFNPCVYHTTIQDEAAGGLTQHQTVTRSSPAGTRFCQEAESYNPLTRHRHAWMSYMVDKAPSQDPLLQRQVRPWEPAEHRPCLTWSRSAYRPFST